MKDLEGETELFHVYGIDRISEEVSHANLLNVKKLFSDLCHQDLFNRPTGDIDVLIGFEYVGFHLIRERSNGNLLQLSNRYSIHNEK